MRLSNRLRMVADMVPNCDAVADIGCDHAYLSVWLLREGKARYAYACDVRKGPLAKAAETIRFFHMQERAETVLCDGLTGLEPGCAQVIVMAGMGGELTSRILTEGSECACSAQVLVLQPQSDWDMVRRRVYALGFAIVDERCVYEDGKYYLCLKAVRGNAEESDYSDSEFRYGRVLPKRKDITYLSWLTEECEKKIAMLRRLSEADTPMAALRLETATAEIKELVTVIRQFTE